MHWLCQDDCCRAKRLSSLAFSLPFSFIDLPDHKGRAHTQRKSITLALSSVDFFQLTTVALCNSFSLNFNSIVVVLCGSFTSFALLSLPLLPVGQLRLMESSGGGSSSELTVNSRCNCWAATTTMAQQQKDGSIHKDFRFNNNRWATRIVAFKVNLKI